jgi:hypothetical protein
MNDEGIEIFYQPSAHTSADSFVLFARPTSSSRAM